MNSNTIPSEQLQNENVRAYLIHSGTVFLHCCLKFRPSASNKEMSKALFKFSVL